MYYRNSNGIIIVYDVTNGESFVHTKSWIEEVKNNCGDNDSMPIVLVGNKCDAPNRIVSEQDQEEYAKLMNMPYFEVSAKENINIDAVFYELARQMAARQDKSNASANNGQRISLNDPVKKPEKNKCCK
jgi:small GTP-binding protein